MKISLKICGVVLCILLAAALTACGGGTSDTTAPSNVSVMINNGAANTSSTSVILSIAATDNIGVTAYYISETSTTPSAMASGWTLVTSTIPYSADVPFILSSGDGTKTIYVWFKDNAGNVSAPATASITLDTTPPIMITPYKNSADMQSIHAFSSSASAPWGFEHTGIDCWPNGNLKPFQAVCSGVVDRLELYYAETISEWHVNVGIKYNDTYTVLYLFEPGPLSTRSDAETQLANIRVSLGQHVSQGDIIGNFYTTGGDWAIVHFGLTEDGVWICPEPYFTSEARDSILSLLHVLYPGANMCY
jgi:hypothetical protein